MNDATSRIIWAYSAQDPASSEPTSAPYHGGSRRGTKSVYLRGIPVGNNDELNEDETISWDLTVKDVPIPDDDTFYYCEIFKAPDLGGKPHHTIGASNFLTVTADKIFIMFFLV